MNFTDKKQPPKGIGIIALEGASQLVSSSFMAPALREKFPQSKIFLITRQNLKEVAQVLHYDGVICGPWMKWKARCKSITHFIDLQKQSDYKGYLKLLQDLDVRPGKLNFKLKVKAETFNAVKNKLIDKGLKLKKFITVVPGASSYEQKPFSHKAWPFTSEFIKQLLDKTSYQILVLTQPDDFILPESNRVFTLLDKMSLDEGVVILNESKAFVGTDQVWSRIAAQMEVPAITLFGPSRNELIQKNALALTAKLPCSPCQKDFDQFDFTCHDNVCMKIHSPGEVFGLLQSSINL